MWPVATDVVWSVCASVCLCVCVCVCVCWSKMAELIFVPFGIWTQVVPRKHVLGGAWIPVREGAFGGHYFIIRYFQPYSVRGSRLN